MSEVIVMGRRYQVGRALGKWHRKQRWSWIGRANPIRAVRRVNQVVQRFGVSMREVATSASRAAAALEEFGTTAESVRQRMADDAARRQGR